MNQRTKLFGQTFYGRWYVTDDGASGGVASSPVFRFTTFGPHGTTVLAAKTPAATSAALHLYAGWPNPFSAFTTVRFDLPSASRATFGT